MKQIHKTPTNEAEFNTCIPSGITNYSDNTIDKEKMRQILAQEQGYICCYCNNKITASEATASIEHFMPQNHTAYPKLQLDYSNLYLACKPYMPHYSQLGKNNTLYCDKSKGGIALPFILNHPAFDIPPDPQLFLSRFPFRHLASGYLVPAQWKSEADIDNPAPVGKMWWAIINGVLNLNNNHLIDRRKKTYDEFSLRIKNQDTAILRKEYKTLSSPDAKGQYRSFVMLRIELLARRLQRLDSLEYNSPRRT